MELKYYAADTPDKLISYLESTMGLSVVREKGSTNRVGLQGMSNMWDKNYRAYYSNNIDDIWNAGGVRFDGQQGELVNMGVNQARALIGEYNTLISKTRLSFEAIAGGVDAETFQSTRLASAISSQLVKDDRLDLKGDSMLEHSGVLGAGFIDLSWNPTAGRLLSKNQLGTKYTGKVDFKILSVYDIFYDYMNPDFYTLDWVVTAWEENRWDLIAQYPALKKDIMALPAVEPRFVFNTGQREEKVKVMKFIHKPSPALPNGRLCIFSSPKTVYFDKQNPYGFIPIVECIPSKILGTGIGYPLFTELLPLQEMIDSSFSTVASNQSAFGVQSVLVPNGADLNIHDIGGLSYIRYNLQGPGSEPKSLQLTNTPPEIFKFIDLLIANQMTISKINSAIRGAPPPGVTSGTAIATLTANALELVQNGGKAYTFAMERVMDYAFKILRIFATEEQVTNMVGRNKETIVKKWKNTDLASIQSIRMKTSNPLADTAAGRITITEHYMELGLIKTPEQYQMVQETGNIEQVNDDTVDEQIWIMEENDMIKEGKPVEVAAAEKHAMHYIGHKALLFDPIVRNDKNKLTALLAHLDAHEDAGKNTDPWILGVVETGQLPPPQQMAPPGMPGLPGAPPEASGGAGAAPPQALPSLEPKKADVSSPAQPEMKTQGGLG